MKKNGTDKDKKNKQRFLSPSFKKGAVKEKPDSQNEYKINLISFEDNPNSLEPSNKSSKNKEEININVIKKKENEKIQKKDSGTLHITDKVNVFPEGHVKSVSSQSQAGKNEDGLPKINQDSYLIIQNEYKLPDFNIFSVLDGHGEYGHLVSRFITKYLTTFFKKNKKMNILKSEDEVYCRLKKNDYDIIKKVFRHAEKDISISKIDAEQSGSTCIMLFQIGDKIICANVGDSRAIMVKGEKGKNIIPLSIDQKPTVPEEKKRIESLGGEISQYEEDGKKAGPYRVWAKGQIYPGIAMSRSIGDFMATKIGVIPEPICLEYTIDKDTKFIIIASDGIWEFLSNKKVAHIALKYYENKDSDGACKALIKEATERWNKEDIVVDDITVIVIFF